MKLTWLREMLPGECLCPDGCPSLPSSRGTQEGNVWFVLPVSLEVTVLVLKSAPSSSRRVPSPAAVGFISCIFSPTRRQRFCSVLKGCPSLQHGGGLGCGSLGRPRPQNQPGLSQRSIWLCRKHVKQQQLLIASDVSERQLAPCSMKQHQRGAGAIVRGCLSPSLLPSAAQG